jgi:hypothetical protein
LDLLANELSVKGQFHERALFHSALSGLLALRKVARDFDRDVRCHRLFAEVEPIPGIPLRQAVQGMGRDRERTVMQWLDRSGPFWDSDRRHGEDEWLECGGEVVTGTAVGEAAYRVREGEECGLASARPGAWDFSPIPVTFGDLGGAGTAQRVEVSNWREAADLRQRLQASESPVTSWEGMNAAARRRFSALRFSGECFDELSGVPFNRSAAQRVLHLLQVLDRFALAFDSDGARSAEGHRIFQQYFTGGTGLAARKASFSDSSDREKHVFRTKLTFPHPDAPGQTLFCPWHGKGKHLLLRLHFSWPIRAGEPVYVVYVGRKLTTR